MIKNHKDRAIVLSRIDYGERDRILTLLAKEKGKVSVLAKGVRAQKSRLAGGIELLSESEISFIEGKSEIKTLTSARLIVHFANLSADLRRMQQAFEFIKIVNSVTEGLTGQEYYHTLLGGLKALNDETYDPDVVDIWFNLNILKISGSAPNLIIDKVTDAVHFEFDHDHQQFKEHDGGTFSKNDLKLLRLSISHPSPPRLSEPLGSEERLRGLTRTLLKFHVTEV
jgi:DNA repair protein RecO (recombination protein O)